MAEIEWYCSKCDEKMKSKKVATMYMKVIGFEKGYMCPKCKAKFLTEDAVCTSIMKKESRGDSKMC